MSIEAMKQALEALENAEYGDYDKKELNEAITAIREALAQPEQEPHSWYSKQEDEWMTHKTRMEHEQLNSYTHKVGKFDLALYTTPPQRPWVGFSEKEFEFWCAYCKPGHLAGIENALKAKNT